MIQNSPATLFTDCANGVQCVLKGGLLRDRTVSADTAFDKTDTAKIFVKNFLSLFRHADSLVVAFRISVTNQPLGCAIDTDFGKPIRPASSVIFTEPPSSASSHNAIRYLNSDAVTPMSSLFAKTNSIPQKQGSFKYFSDLVRLIEPSTKKQRVRYHELR